MCIIVVKSSSAKHPSEEVIRKCWQTNPDGAGFAYGDASGGVSVSKGFMSLASLLEGLKVVQAVENSWYILHFRIGTHGSKGPENTHPFWITEGKVAMVHNGVLSYSRQLKDGDTRSDTAAFTQDILAKLPEAWYKDPAFVHVIEDYLGHGNKFAVIDYDGITLLNKTAFNEDKETGLWFSNYSWRTTPSYTNHTPATRTPVSKQNYTYSGGQYQQGFPKLGTETGTDTSSATQKNIEFPGLNKRLDEGEAKWKAACLNIRQRMGAMVRSGMMAATDASAIREYLDEVNVLPEEVEDFLDFLVEQRTAVPGANLEDALIVLNVKTILEAIEIMDEMRFGANDDDTKLNFDIPEDLDDRDMPGDTTTKVISTGKLSQADLEPEYNKDNSICFKSSWARIQRHNGADAIAFIQDIVESHQPGNWGFNYSSADGSEGWISFSAIKQVNGLMVLNRPAREHLVQFVGSDIIMIPVAGQNQRGILQGVVGDSYKMRMREHPLNISDSLDTVLRIIIVELGREQVKQVQEVKALTANT